MSISFTPRLGRIHLISWGGSHNRTVTVIGETSTRFRVLYDDKPAGDHKRRRGASAWTAPMHSVGLVPKHAVLFLCRSCDATVKDITQSQCNACQGLSSQAQRDMVRRMLADAQQRYADGKTLSLALAESVAGYNDAAEALLAVIDEAEKHMDRRWGEYMLKVALENA